MKSFVHEHILFLLTAVICLALTQPAFSSDRIKPDNTGGQTVNPVLLDIVGVLANRASFRKNSVSLNEIFSKYCKTKKIIKDEVSHVFYYDCDVASTGMRSVWFDSNEQAGEKNYLMTLNIHFEYKAYEAIKRLVISKLGQAKRKHKDYTGWEFKSDKGLNEFGNPVIEVSRDKTYESGTFSVGLEQGESDN